ncbi:MAG: filamentous hemagglutinin N-terminal domain-containing protein [Xenococcaceae cyanobacterium MO_167.B52]|nr:filamentous hemagglutinin N-terminal domain-containing protein [Xenococcaceae cyanobacterium MO_167.B52]
MKSNTFLVLSLAYCLVGISLQSPPTSAQITRDGTTSTTVNVNGNNFEINNGDHIGDNLFHSFEQFSVPTLGSAVFNNASDIANIFSRVTGNNISSIDGLISANGTANLFLINPNGIIFDENASLNLGGSFFASTADSLLFEDNIEFSAVNPQAPPLLKVNMPIGLNLGNNLGEIVNRSFVQNSAGDFVGLEVAPGKNLTLVGGNINFEAGEATARGGNIELGGLSAAGIVGINDDGSLNFPEDVARADITLSNAADVDVRGTGGGSITINARNLNLEAGDFGGSFINAGITADSTSSEAQAGDIRINATDNVTVDDSLIINQVDSLAVGDAGDVTIDTGSLSLTNGGIVYASTLGQGDAGLVEITATDSITIDGENSNGIPSLVASQVITGAMGDVEGVIIKTDSLSLTNGGLVSASIGGQGDAGLVEITATDSITIDGESSNSLPSAVASQFLGVEGDVGGVTINTGSLTLTNGGIVSASTFGQGNAGSVEITATDIILIDGERSDGFASGVNSQVNPGAEGDAGGVAITTGSLSLTNGGRVSASSFGQGNSGSVEITATDSITIDGERSGGFVSGAFSQVNLGAEGDAGGVTINTGSLSLTNGGQVSADTFDEGNAGSVEITATDSITIDGENSNGFASGVSSGVDLGAEGDAGGVTINTGFLTLTNGGRVTASTFGQGNAGSVKITATDTISVDGAKSNGIPSGVFSQIGLNVEGDAGSVIINTGSLSLTNGGRVGASTFGQANAGSVEITATDTILIDGAKSNGISSGVFSTVQPEAVRNAEGITINTGSLALTNGGRVSASTFGQGNAGDVTVNARESIIISGATDFFRSGISADALVSNGNGGDVNVFTNQLTIDNGGTIEAGNFDSLGVFEPGTGKPGNINIQANSLNMSNQASIEAATQSEIGEGANINLTIAEDIILRNNSLVSARALQNADGGNVIINASNGFIIAFPNQNNDIIANAQQGNGGRINISTQAIFGLEERRSTPPNQTNDIDASSEFGLQGEITINTPEADPTKGLIELPESVGDASDQISQNPCERGIDSKFINTGRGGLPPSPTETLSSREVWKDVQLPTQLIKNSANTVKQSNTNPERIVEATSWIINEEGIVELVAEESSDTRPRSCR